MIVFCLSLFISLAVSAQDYPSKLGIDYTQYGVMAENFWLGETEFLESIKDETGEDRADSIELWGLSLDDLYADLDSRSLDGDLVDFFQESTPMMVNSWKGLGGALGLINETHVLEQERTRLNDELARKKRYGESLDMILKAFGKGE